MSGIVASYAKLLDRLVNGKDPREKQPEKQQIDHTAKLPWRFVVIGSVYFFFNVALFLETYNPAIPYWTSTLFALLILAQLVIGFHYFLFKVLFKFSKYVIINSMTTGPNRVEEPESIALNPSPNALNIYGEILDWRLEQIHQLVPESVGKFVTEIVFTNSEIVEDGIPKTTGKRFLISNHPLLQEMKPRLTWQYVLGGYPRKTMWAPVAMGYRGKVDGIEVYKITGSATITLEQMVAV